MGEQTPLCASLCPFLPKNGDSMRLVVVQEHERMRDSTRLVMGSEQEIRDSTRLVMGSEQRYTLGCYIPGMRYTLGCYIPGMGGIPGCTYPGWEVYLGVHTRVVYPRWYILPVCHPMYPGRCTPSLYASQYTTLGTPCIHRLHATGAATTGRREKSPGLRREETRGYEKE